MESVKVNAAINGGVAQTDVEQVWRNDTERPQEGSYLFPVPEGATLSDFALYDGDKKMAARLLDKDEARETYEGIVRRWRDPALLQYVGRGAYEVRLFPVPPRATRRITLKYTEALRPEGPNTRRYVYSFVADGLGGTERRGTVPKSTVVTVTVKDDAPLANIYSPTRDVSIRRRGDRSATVSFEASNERVRDDFILYYSTTAKDPVGLSLLAYNVAVPRARTAAFSPGDGRRDSGYFLVLAAPKTQLADAQIQPKRVVLVLDRSGSMSGEKIEQAKGALAFVLKNLRPADEFNVVSFSESSDVLADGKLLLATPDNVKRGLTFVKDISAAGGTNIGDALQTALKLLPASGDGKQNMVVFLTDGLPTVGETNQARITDDARTLSRPRHVRLFDFGVGYDVDVHFLDRLAQQNKGDSDYVRPEENIEAKVSRFYQKVASPVLTDVRLELSGIQTADIYPRPSELPDMFAESQLLIAGRYAGSGPVTARLVGTVNGRPTSFSLASTLPAVADTNDYLPRLWATRKIGFLLDAIRLRETEAGGKDELVNEVVRLSKEYGVITPYTSFLVTDGSENVPPPMPGPIPLGAGGFGGGRRGAADAFAAPTGATAMTQSQALSRAKKSSVANGSVALQEDEAKAAQQRMRVIGAKTFYLRGDLWTDSAFDPAKHKDITSVQAFSDAHFALLKALPDLAAYSSLGDSVLIVLENGRVVKIVKTAGTEKLTGNALRRLRE